MSSLCVSLVICFLSFSAANISVFLLLVLVMFLVIHGFCSYLGQDDGVAGVAFPCYCVNRLVFSNYKFSPILFAEWSRHAVWPIGPTAPSNYHLIVFIVKLLDSVVWVCCLQFLFSCFSSTTSVRVACTDMLPATSILSILSSFYVAS